MKSLFLPLIAGLVLVGCSSKEVTPFSPKTLLDEGRGVIVSKTAPINCKAIGESEGIEFSHGNPNISKAELRDSALIDLRNNAGFYSGQKGRAMLYVIEEKVTCEDDKKGCSDNKNIKIIQLKGIVFDCKE